MTEEKMLADGYCSREVLLFLRNCMEAKLNMVFCGCPGAGKTELLKFLTQFIPKHEKVMTIEDNLEIHYRDINPGANCVELKVDEEFFSYTKAIKSCTSAKSAMGASVRSAFYRSEVSFRMLFDRSSRTDDTTHR